MNTINVLKQNKRKLDMNNQINQSPCYHLRVNFNYATMFLLKRNSGVRRRYSVDAQNCSNNLRY